MPVTANTKKPYKQRLWNDLGHYLRREDIPPTTMRKRYMECKMKKWQGRRRMNLATRVKEDSRKARVAHEELQEMTDDRQR